MKKKPKVKKITYYVDPYTSAAGIALAGAPLGYHFWKMERRGTKATVWYVLD